MAASKGEAEETRRASSDHCDCGSASSERECELRSSTIRGSPAAASASRSLTGRLVRPLASIVWL